MNEPFEVFIETSQVESNLKVQANINLRNSIFPFLNQVMFYFKRKIYVLTESEKLSRPKTDVLCK